MDMSDFIYYCTFVVTVGLALGALALAHTAISKGGNKKIYSNRFAVASVLSGLVSGTFLYYGTLWLFDVFGYHVNVGHGEVLIATPLFNFVLGLVLAVPGKVLLQWHPFRL
jgi:hypothetical protein